MVNSMQDNEAFELQDWIELSNGCACCSVKNDFVQALEALMRKSGRYDYILIETTGNNSQPGQFRKWYERFHPEDLHKDKTFSVLLLMSQA